MAAEEKRLMKLIYLLSQTDGYLTAGELAKELNLSERTVKSDAEHLREFLQRCGCTLESVRGKGYTLRVNDPARFEQTREWLDILFHNVENDVKDRHPYQLARAIMCLETADSDGYFRLEQLADRFYISVSTLKKGMPWVRSFLDSFGLTLRSRPGRGLKIHGDELSQRLCLLELYENHFRKRVVPFNNHIYERAFADRSDKDQIRRLTLDCIRNSDIELFDSYCNRLVDYLLLQRNRSLEGRLVALDAVPWGNWTASLKQLPEWRLANSLTQTLNEQIPGFSFSSQGEIAAVAVLMLIWSDWNGIEGLEKRFPQLYPRAVCLSQELASLLGQQWDLPACLLLPGLSDSSQPSSPCPPAASRAGSDPVSVLSQTLVPECLRLLIQQKFGYNRCQMLGNSCSENDIKKSPLTMALADWLGELLLRRLQLEVSEFNTQLMAVSIYQVIDQITYPYVPRRLLVCARNGKASARIISRDIKRRLGDWWIKELTVAPLYEARKYSPQDYDVLVGTFYPSAYRYVWPFIAIHSPMAPDDYERIRREALLGGYDLSKTVSAIHWDVLELHHDFLTASLSSMLQLLAYQWGGDLSSKKRLAAFFSIHRHLRSRSQLLPVIVPASQTGGRQIFELYLLAKPLECDGESVHAVLFLAASFCQSPAILRFLEHAIRILQAEFDALLPGLTRENLIPVLTEAVRLHL